MSRENDIDALIDHLDDAMACARRLKVPDIIFYLSLAAVAIADIVIDEAGETPTDTPFL